MKLFPDIWRIPFRKSPLVFFVGEVTAPLAGGMYEFPDTKFDFSPSTSLTNQAIYFLWDFDFSVDVAESDYQGAISLTPLVSVYLSAKPNEPIFRQPFRCPKYYDGKPVYQGTQIHQVPNKLQLQVTGTLNQTAALLGKASIKAIVQFTAHEITDPDYKKMFLEGLDMGGGEGGPATPRAPQTPAQNAGTQLAKDNAKTPGISTAEGLSLPL